MKASRPALMLLLAVAAWMSVPSAFTGSSAAAPGGRVRTPLNGYRLDWMLEQKDGTNSLQTQDGYWVGECGFDRSQNAQGLRYRQRPTAQEYKDGKEVDGLMYQIGPLKFKIGEVFGGCATNDALKDVKRKIAKEGITDPVKLEENKYWKARYGYERWEPDYVDQAQGGVNANLFPTLAQWSGLDPKKEERGVTWFEADYGKPWLQKYLTTKQKGWVSAAQIEKEFDTGKLNGKYLSLPKPNDNRAATGIGRLA